MRQTHKREIIVCYGYRDRLMLICEGHIFRRIGRRLPSGNKLRWGCDCDHCPSLLFTTKKFEFIKLRNAHTDTPNPTKVAILRARDYIKKKSVENSTRNPREIFNEAMEIFPKAISGPMNADNVSQIVNYAREHFFKFHKLPEVCYYFNL